MGVTLWEMSPTPLSGCLVPSLFSVAVLIESMSLPEYIR